MATSFIPSSLANEMVESTWNVYAGRFSTRDVTRDLRKNRSSPLNHIFSTIPAFAPSSTQNWVCSCSGHQGVVVEKIYIRAQSSFSEFAGI